MQWVCDDVQNQTAGMIKFNETQHFIKHGYIPYTHVCTVVNITLCQRSRIHSKAASPSVSNYPSHDLVIHPYSYPFILLHCLAALSWLYPSSPHQRKMQHMINSLAQSFHCFDPMKGAVVPPCRRSQMNSPLVPSGFWRANVIEWLCRTPASSLGLSSPVALSHRKGSNINQHSN